MSVLVINIPNHVQGNTFDGWQFNAKNEDLTPCDMTSVTDLSMVFNYGSTTGTISATFTIGSGLEWVSQSEGKFKISKQIINWSVGKHFLSCSFTKDANFDERFKGGFSITN